MPHESDVAWLVEHDAELMEQYPGQWVAVWQGRIIGIGATASEAAAEADRVASREDYLLHAIDEDTDVIYA